MPARLDLGPLWSFYALAGRVDAPDVLRVALDAAAQRELSGLFAAQLAAFGLETAERVPYDPGYRPDDGELLVLRAFALPAAVAALAARPDLPPLGGDALEAGAVRALVGVPQATPGAPPLCFQAVDARQLLRRERVSLFLSRDTFVRERRPGLVVRDALTAVAAAGDLLFPAEPPVRRFVDLAPAFAEATNPQLHAFFADPLFAPADAAALVAAADGWVRRKVRAIADRGILRAASLARLSDVAREFGVELAVDRLGGRRTLAVPRDRKGLKALLRLLDQDYLRSPLTQDRFQVSSKRRVEPRRPARARPLAPSRGVTRRR